MWNYPKSRTTRKKEKPYHGIVIQCGPGLLRKKKRFAAVMRRDCLTYQLQAHTYTLFKPKTFKNVPPVASKVLTTSITVFTISNSRPFALERGYKEKTTVMLARICAFLEFSKFSNRCGHVREIRNVNPENLELQATFSTKTLIFDRCFWYWCGKFVDFFCSPRPRSRYGVH